MSGDIQQGSGSISSPDSGQDHHKFNQASRSDQRERQPKSVRFVTDDPESPQHPDLSGGPASANNVDASRRSGCVPDLEAINCTISSMAAENIQENQDSDAEPDACVTNAHGGNPTSSVSEDYVPWFGLDADHYELPKYRGIIPNIHRFSRKLYLVFVVMVVSTSIIRLTTTTYFDHIFIDFIRWMMNLTVGLVLDCLFSVMFGELCSFVLTSKLSFNSGCSLLSIPVIVLIIIFVYPLNPLGAYRMFPVWHTGFLPQPFHGCEARVSPTQSSLFTQHTYARQFARIWDANATDFSDFDMQAFDAIRHDQTLCNQGFIGNADVYGLGSRISLYLQWLTALLVNNFVPRSRHEFRKIYVAYSLGLCIATLVFTFSTACTFAIEIEILYWAYWGGHLCVFVTSPSYTRLGSKVKWIRLDWMTGINYLLHVLMFYHSTFFWHYGYDQFFSRMPCGTYHFFFAALLDPSKSFWHCRDVLTVIIFPARVALMLIIPIVILVLISEIKSSIYESPVFQNLCIYLRGSGRPNSETVLAIDAAQASLSSRLRHRFRASSFLWVRPYRGLRGWVHLPHNSREGIRLITPLDIKERMYVYGIGHYPYHLLILFQEISNLLRHVRTGLLCRMHRGY